MSRNSQITLQTIFSNYPNLSRGSRSGRNSYYGCSRNSKGLCYLSAKKDELEKDKLTPVELVQTTWQCLYSVCLDRAAQLPYYKYLSHG